MSKAKQAKSTKSVSPLVLELNARRVELKSLKELVKVLTEKVKTERADKAKARHEAAIAKAKAKLEALTSKPVGAKAAKAARKPGPVTVTKGEPVAA